jgi:hypothetical protein
MGPGRRVDGVVRSRGLIQRVIAERPMTLGKVHTKANAAARRTPKALSHYSPPPRFIVPNFRDRAKATEGALHAKSCVS